MSNTNTCFAAMLAGISSIAPLAWAQCPRTLPGSLSPEVNIATAVIVWDRDGAGPEAPLLVISAQAFANSPTGAQGLIGWDGQKYVRMFSTTPPDMSFSQLFIHSGQLFGLSLANELVQFNSSSWTSVTPVFGVIKEATSFGGEIVVCGTQQGTNITGVFALRAGAWVQLGAAFNGDVNSIAIASGQLVATGAFTLPGATNIRAAYFDGAAWQPLGTSSTFPGPGFPATRIRAVGDKVLVGNDAVIAILSSGAWSRSPEGGKIYGTSETRVYVHEHITSGNLRDPIKAYNGSTWTMLDDASDEFLDPMAAVIEYQGRVFAFGGGNPVGTAVAARVTGIELVDSRWRPFGEGSGGPVRSMAIAADGSLLTLCGFRGSKENTTLNTYPPHPFARSWDGARFSPAGASLPGPPNVNNPPRSVFFELTADAEFGMLAGGYFFGDYGGTPLAAVVQYLPGAGWGSFGSRLYKFRDIFNNLNIPKVYKVIRYQSELIAVGEFSLTTGEDNTSIVRYQDGVWVPLAPAMAFPAGSRFRNAIVHDNTLFLAGTSVGTPGGGSTFTHFNGTSWSAPTAALAGASPFCVHASAVHAVGSGNTTVVRWNGAGWDPVGPNLPSAVLAIASYRGSLYAGGAFGVRKFDGATWATLQNVGFFGTVQALLEHNGELAIGTDGTASFNSGATSHSATGLARFTADNIPVILQQPLSRTGACGETTTLTVTAANYGPTSYRWHKDGVLLANGPTGTGSTLSGASTKSLVITNLGAGDPGSYTCNISVSTLCGIRTTAAATVAVTCCPADLNNDNVVDDADFILFQISYDALGCGAPSMPSGCQADLNNDGFVDDADFILFAVAYDALGCP